MNPETASVEYEIKLNLHNAERYGRLCNALGEPLREIRQENYFFDTPDQRLLQSRWALRIRVSATTDAEVADEHSDAEITLKGPRRGVGVVNERTEINGQLSLSVARAAIADGLDLTTLDVRPAIEVRKMFFPTRQSSDSQKLLPLVSFENKRIVFDKTQDWACFLELDLTSYSSDALRYELEIEFQRPDAEKIARVTEHVQTLFQKLDIPYTPQTTSKFAMALKNHSLLG